MGSTTESEAPAQAPGRWSRPNAWSWTLCGLVPVAAAAAHAFGLGGSPVTLVPLLGLVLWGYTLSSATGLSVLGCAVASHLTLRALNTDFAAHATEALLAAETWVPLVLFALVATTCEVCRGQVAERDRRIAKDEEALLAAERRAAEDARLSRSLGAVAGGLLSAFEPDRMLRRFTVLVRTLLGAEAALTLAIDETRNTFQILEASGGAEGSPADLKKAVYPLGGISREGIVSLSFSAGDAGRLAPVMRNGFSASAGFAAPILRGKQLAGALLVGYREASQKLSETDRSLLAGSAAFCATLFESMRLDRELRSSNRVKTEFTSTVSHELRTPLNAITGYCDLLLDATMGEINDEQRDALSRLRQAAVQLSELIVAVLDVDRLESGYLSMSWAECDLNTFYEDLARSVPRHWMKDGVELRWVGSASRMIRTDPEKLRLLLRNLIHNALKFTPAGSVTVEMSVTPGTLMFTVRDTGIGIKPEIRQSLFEMFSPGEKTDNRIYGGLGLGLYLADRMVKALWGQISIDSTPGRGTTVRVVLPIEEPIANSAAD